MTSLPRTASLLAAMLGSLLLAAAAVRPAAPAPAAETCRGSSWRYRGGPIRQTGGATV